jgi:hypothetical protein
VAAEGLSSFDLAMFRSLSQVAAEVVSTAMRLEGTLVDMVKLLPMGRRVSSLPVTVALINQAAQMAAEALVSLVVVVLASLVTDPATKIKAGLLS